MAALLRNNYKRKINDTKDEDLYVDYRFIFRSATRAKILLSHRKCIKIEIRNRLTPHHFEDISFLKLINNFAIFYSD